MIALSLEELAGVVSGQLLVPDGAKRTEAVTSSVVVDSRLARPGAVFIAMRGEETDGHHFAGSAIDAGALVVIAERPLDVTVPIILVEDSLIALTSLAREVVARVRALGRLRVVAVTGSNGKTTTKNMLRAVLEREGQVVAPQGSFNNHVGAPLSMLEVTEESDFLIVEMGASAHGDIGRHVSIVMPDIAIVLKVGLAHAGGFGSIEETQKAKAELVTGLPESAVAVLNIDDSRVWAMAAMTHARVVSFGFSDSATIRAEDISTSVDGTRFALVLNNSRYDVPLRIIGEHNVMNALATLAAASELGVEPTSAISALTEMVRAERWRMELLQAPNDITVINDGYNASPDSMAAGLKSLAEITRGSHRAVAVLGEMADLGDVSDEEHDRIGRLAVRLNIDRLIVVGHAARHIHNAAGLEGSWDGESVLVPDAEKAYDLLRQELRSGDVVLVKSSKSANLRFLGDRIAGVS